ncbi:methyl-accepting chemotaxis protein [Magnetospirillum aberrantis]|uniref:Methyl-accepting chemotaxis protein n=1 Tax=Magnetospirillum aberrantis SpK TaxID=908842 RepID=A0A7C9US82_9PROT|nr:methyl-accepting chemotaxis protein [Magnetospirillum aberrantis]NFV79107.1 methyl-accepting chemotaxis protein [Magnetospirillum aberrantis SpK]
MHTAEFSVWKKITLRRKLIIVAALFTMVLGGLIVFNAAILNAQKDQGTVGGLAARQRTLVHRAVEEMVLVGIGQPADLEATFKLLKDSQEVLLDGGMLPGAETTGLQGMMPATQNTEIRSRLMEQGTLIRALEAEAARYLALAANDTRRGDRLREVRGAAANLQQSVEQIMRLYVNDRETRLNQAIFWQVVGGIVVALAGVTISTVISRQLADPLASCAAAAREIAQGNLRQSQLTVTSADEVGVLQQSFNEMLTSLRDIALQSRSVCENLTLAAAQILTSTQEQAAGTKQQAAAVQEITTTVEQINLSSKQVAERSRQVAGTADAVSQSGHAGLQAVHEASVGMEAIREQAENVAENIITLSERTQAVGEIIATVNDIAEQSNLVALNAAIEAADARESGRRFSVVAGEIKNLADQAKEATAQVRGILEQTQKGINTSVMLTEEALKRVETGRERTNVSEQVIRQMANNIQESVQAFQQIVGATNQQQIGLEQVTQALHEIRQASQQTAATTGQLEKAAVELTRLGEQLAKTLEKYKL